MRRPIPTPYSVKPLKRFAGIAMNFKDKKVRLRSRGLAFWLQPSRSECDRGYWAGGLEPSVAQPPLPLQEFLPLQPWSPVLQPPLPLHEFWPLQACFSLEKDVDIWPRFEPLETPLVEDGDAFATAVLPAMKPARAAPIMSDFIDFVIAAILLYRCFWEDLFFRFVCGPSRLRAKHSVGFPAIREPF